MQLVCWRDYSLMLSPQVDTVTGQPLDAKMLKRLARRNKRKAAAVAAEGKK